MLFKKNCAFGAEETRRAMVQAIHRDPWVLKKFSCACGAEETRRAMVQGIHRDPLVLNFFSCAFGAVRKPGGRWPRLFTGTLGS